MLMGKDTLDVQESCLISTIHSYDKMITKGKKNVVVFIRTYARLHAR